MDFWVILYSLLCVVIGGGSVTFLYKRGQTMGAMILLVLAIIVFIFFGLRWFPDGNLNGTKRGTVQWPPIVNMCPDFMVSWTDPNSTPSKIYCYDTNDIYGTATLTSSSIKSLTPNLAIGAEGASKSAFLQKTPGVSGADAIVKQSQDIGSTKKWPLLNDMAKNLNSIVTGAPYLRWEGVWDGRTATVAKAPLP